MGWSNSGWRSDQGGWYKNAAAAASSTETWDPSNTSASLTLSGGNLVITNGGGSTAFFGTRGINSRASGAFSYQIAVTAGNAAALSMVGICNSSYDHTSEFVGKTTASLGWASDGTVYYNNAPLTTIQTFTTGDTLTIATDLSGKLFWFRTNSGNWNNNGSAVPFSTGGVSFAVTGPYFPAVSLRAPLDSWTANFSATPPAGGSVW